jgi:hypothetical protein
VLERLITLSNELVICQSYRGAVKQAVVKGAHTTKMVKGGWKDILVHKRLDDDGRVGRSGEVELPQNFFLSAR